MARCLISLGSNVNASESVFSGAIDELKRRGVETALLSRVVTTRPVGAVAGPPFLNAAAQITTDLSASTLLRVLHDVESQFGRTRTIHWGPRTLDLDLLLYGEEIIDQPDLVVPHPALWYRRFVLDPAMEVAPQMLHPVLNCTILELHAALTVRPLTLCLSQTLSQIGIGLDDAQLVSRLNEKGGELRWCQDDGAATCDEGPYFARVIVKSAALETSRRTQPANSRDRTIVIAAESLEQMLEQLRDLESAIVG